MDIGTTEPISELLCEIKGRDLFRAVIWLTICRQYFPNQLSAPNLSVEIFPGLIVLLKALFGYLLY